MKRRPVIVALFFALWISVATGCARHTDSDLWLSRIEQAHEMADGAVNRHEWDKARRALDEAVRAPVPKDIAPEDARGIRQDLFYRLALVELQAKRPNRAQEWADQGLLLGERADVFGANLYIARGRAHEAVGEDVAAGRDYHTALTISEALLEHALGTEERR